MAFQHKIIPDSYIPGDQRPEGSINAALHELSVQREIVSEAYGMLLRLPRTGIVGFIVEPRTGGACFRVLRPNPALTAYPQGCDLWVSDWEIQRAVEMQAVPAHLAETVQFGLENVERADATRSTVLWFDSEDEARTEKIAHPERYLGTMRRRVAFLPSAERWRVAG